MNFEESRTCKNKVKFKKKGSISRSIGIQPILWKHGFANIQELEVKSHGETVTCDTRTSDVCSLTDTCESRTSDVCSQTDTCDTRMYFRRVQFEIANIGEKVTHFVIVEED